MAERKLGDILLKNVRLSFADIWRMKSVQGGNPRFSANFLIAPDDPQVKLIKKTIKEVMVAKWGDNLPKLKAEKFFFRDGDPEEWDGYAGMWYVSAANKNRFQIIDRNKRPLTEEDGKPYSGCYVNCLVRAWAQDDPEFGKRINATLEVIQFYKDGEAFGAGPVDIDDYFDDLGDGDDDMFGGGSDDEDDEMI